MEISNEQVRIALLSVIAFIVAVTFHEFGHAFVADRLGDRLPRAQGRLTLSPRSHIDLVGTIIVPLVAGLMAGMPFIAWGKPVQTLPSTMTRRLPRNLAILLVAIAGPLMNLVLAVLASVALLAAAQTGHLSKTVADGVIRFVVMLNISLLFFNLLPIPPLDGRAILPYIVPRSLHRYLPAFDRYGMIVLIILMLTGLVAVLMWPAMLAAAAWQHALTGALGFGRA